MRTYNLAQGLYLVLCGDLTWREIKKKKNGDICTPMADSFCCIAEADTAVLSKYIPLKY